MVPPYITPEVSPGMTKLKSLLLFFLFLSSFTAVLAQDGLIIRDIIIVGTTRTDQGVIRSQLPFREGEFWREEYAPLTVRRLTTLDIFSYEPMRITAEPISEHECRVIVRTADPFILFKDPAEFTIMSGMRLSYSQVYLTAYNPFGTGQNLNLNITWGDNYSYGGSVTSPLGPGMVSLGGRYYRNDYTFSNDISYESSGWSVESTYWYWWNRFFRQSTRLQYHAYVLEGEQSSRIIPSLGLLFDDTFSGSVNASLGIPLKDDPLFWRVQGALFKQAGPVITLARGGYTSINTPENLQFIVGGYSQLPLRGENPWHLARAYVIGTGEYHFSLGDRFAPIVFVDGGWVWNDDPAPGLDELLVNIGLGFAVYTPLGIPVRLDIAMNPVTQSWGGLKVGFGHSYIPLF